MARVERHLRFGWWYLVMWVILGLVLETLHGFKTGWYLDVGNETRRLMLTLAHAHGAFLALVNIALGLTARSIPGFSLKRSASFSLVGATILMPVGFLLGGLVIYGGDPGLGIWLVPLGAFLLVYAVVAIALAVTAQHRDGAITTHRPSPPRKRRH